MKSKLKYMIKFLIMEAYIIQLGLDNLLLTNDKFRNEEKIPLTNRCVSK